MTKIEKLLRDNGYKTVSGKDDVIKAIKNAADNSSKPLCSGHEVFPDGRKCDGCDDCKEVSESIQRCSDEEFEAGKAFLWHFWW